MPAEIAAESLTAAQQIAVLRRLKPQAAAFAIGVPMSTLRDRTHQCPPGENGSYDVQDLVRFATDSSTPIELPDDELEPVLRAVEVLLFKLTEHNLPAVQKTILAGMDAHGDRFGALFVSELFRELEAYNADGWLNAPPRSCRVTSRSWQRLSPTTRKSLPKRL